MEKLRFFLMILTGCIVGVFIGDSLWHWHDYTVNPGLYMLNSAPWYTAIQINGIATAIAVAVLLLLLWLLRSKK